MRHGQTATCAIKTNSLNRLQECFSTAGWPYAERGTHKPKAALKAIPFPVNARPSPSTGSDHREDDPCFHTAMRYQASRIVPAQRGSPLRRRFGTRPHPKFPRSGRVHRRRGGPSSPAARARAARSDVKAGPQRYRAHAARASRAPGG